MTSHFRKLKISRKCDWKSFLFFFFAGEMNSGFVNDTGSVAGSRKSLNLHPVLLMHPGQDDTYSQFSQRTVPRSTHSGHYSHPMHHNYQM